MFIQAPLEQSALAAALQPFGESRMLPREAYVDEALFVWEQQHFLEGGWTCVGRSDVLAEPGDQRAEAIGRGGVFLVRAGDGVLRAFANACRHRGHELLPCGGPTVNRAGIACPYHAWSYRLDGSLRRTPGFEPGEGFSPEEHGLVELAAEEWHGLVFVNVSGDAGPLAAHVEGLDELVAPYEPERLRRGGRHDYVVQANWKLLNENYQECYHCPVIHPELCIVSPPDSGSNYLHPGAGAWVGGSMALRPGCETMSLDGRSRAGGSLRGLAGSALHEVLYIGVFPNLLLSLHPDYVMTHLVTPLGPERSRVVCEWSFAPEDLGRDGFDPSYAVDFWDVVNRQDWAACESVQRGLRSPAAAPGPLSKREDAVYQFVTMVARGYQGLPVVAGALTPG